MISRFSMVFLLTVSFAAFSEFSHAKGRKPERNLSPPTSVSASALSDSEIRVVWSDNNKAETAYSVESSLSESGPFSEIFRSSKNSTVFLHRNLNENTTHFYKVQALGRKGNASGYSSTVKATTESKPDPIPDTIPPKVAISEPLDGSELSGIQNISAKATDNVEVKSIQFFVNNISLGFDYSDPYVTSLDTENLPDGTHVLKVRALDTSNNSAEHSIQIQVKNTPETDPDPKDPLDNGMLNITHPKEGELKIYGTIFTHCPLFAVTAEAGVSWVEFIIDGVVIDRGYIGFRNSTGNLLENNTTSDMHIEYEGFSFKDVKDLTDASLSHQFSTWLASGSFGDFTKFFMFAGVHNLEIKGYDMNDQLITQSQREFYVVDNPPPEVWQSPPVTTEGNNQSLDSEEEILLGLINEYRLSVGVGVVSGVSTLNAAAQGFSDSMGAENYFPDSHLDSSGRNPSQRAHDAGYTGYSVSENIYSGFCDAKSAFQAWRNSEGHNTNMIYEGHQVIGIGRSLDQHWQHWYRCYWVTDFGA